MSLHSIRAAKKKGIITILERGSAHISFQNNLLNEEYKKFGIDFNIDQNVIEKELKEYKEVDYISIPSTFAKNSFLHHGINEKKLIVNPYGVSDYFNFNEIKKTSKFTILYLGNLSIQKGLIYLFEALSKLNIPLDLYEVWFIGSIEKEIEEIKSKYQKSNWTFWGHVNHYKLSDLLNSCDVGVLPTIQDGFGMVLLQMLKCGIPVIATTNSGALDCIKDYENGFIIPIRDSNEIKKKIEVLFSDRILLNKMKINAIENCENKWSWNDYGSRYSNFIESIP